MPTKYTFISLFFLAQLAIGCSNLVQIPKLEFVSIRHPIAQDTILFPEMSYPYYYILRFSSDADLEKCDPDTKVLLLYASAQRQGFHYCDLFDSNDSREEGIINTVSVEKVQGGKGKYYYDAAFALSLPKDELINVNDTIYCKIFFVRMSWKINESDEMLIPKDSLRIFLDETDERYFPSGELKTSWDSCNVN